MYGVQFDQLAELTGDERAARAAAARWRDLGYAQTARLLPGPDWLRASKPGWPRAVRVLPRTARAVPPRAHQGGRAARLALEAPAATGRASAFWRCERRIRAGHGVGMRQHLPDAEVHWPDGGRGAVGGRVLGGRGGAVTQDGAADRRDHAGDPRPYRGLRLSGRRGGGARPRAAGTPACCTCAHRPRSARCCAPGIRSAPSPPGSRSATSRPAPRSGNGRRRSGNLYRVRGSTSARSSFLSTEKQYMLLAIPRRSRNAAAGWPMPLICVSAAAGEGGATGVSPYGHGSRHQDRECFWSCECLWRSAINPA